MASVYWVDSTTRTDFTSNWTVVDSDTSTVTFSSNCTSTTSCDATTIWINSSDNSLWWNSNEPYVVERPEPYHYRTVRGRREPVWQEAPCGIQERQVAAQERARAIVEREEREREYERQRVEEQRAALALQAEYRAREQEREQQRIAANVRAKGLLDSYLNDEQRRTLERQGWFIVIGGATGRRYRIWTNSYAGNVRTLGDNDNEIQSHCCHAAEVVPLWDHLLTQKVMLENDESEFLRKANSHRLVA